MSNAWGKLHGVNLKHCVNSAQSKVDYARVFTRAYSHVHLMELMEYEHVTYCSMSE